MSSPTFMSLPREIRDAILEMTLPEQLFVSDDEGRVIRAKSPVFLVSHQLYQETKGVHRLVLQRDTHIFMTSEGMQTAIQATSPETREYIRKIDLDFRTDDLICFFNTRWKQEIPVDNNCGAVQLLRRFPNLKEVTLYHQRVHPLEDIPEDLFGGCHDTVMAWIVTFAAHHLKDYKVTSVGEVRNSLLPWVQSQLQWAKSLKPRVYYWHLNNRRQPVYHPSLNWDTIQYPPLCNHLDCVDISTTYDPNA